MAEDVTSPPPAAKFQFHYIKSPSYREIACHGAIGGITPQGKLWVTFYSERTPIPRMVEYTVDIPADQKEVALNESESTPSFTESRQGVIRNVEITSYMDIDVAKSLHKWLGERLEGR